MALVISSTPLDINRAYLFALVGLWTSDWLLTALCLHRVEWKLSTASLSWLRTSLRLQSNRTATHANTERSYFGNEKEQAGRNSSGHTFGRPREEDRSNGLRWPFAMLYLMVRYGALAALALLLHASFVASEITFTPSQHLCERSALGIRIVVGLLITCSTVAFYWSLTCSLRRQAPNPRPRLLIIGLCTLLAGELAVWITFTVLSSAPIQDSVSIVTQCQSSPQSPTLLAALICTIGELLLSKSPKLSLLSRYANSRILSFAAASIHGLFTALHGRPKLCQKCECAASSTNGSMPLLNVRTSQAFCGRTRGSKLYFLHTFSCLALATQTVALALVALDMDASLQLGVATVASFT